ncbi:hypothetical protein PybrP1_002798 [[Pythium] brassicae (nom. inval.)]|nr:hypothetical protein PybrP1_002798 [[Pythium] brassicae (nom. inval.)]
MLLMFYLPNRAYYPQLAHLSRDELFHNLKSVLIYASLELVSFLAMEGVIKRQLGVSRTRQLTFVLKTQWHTVQSKFLVWVVYIVQSYLFHFGADFGFQFEWLSKTPQTASGE